MLKTLRYVNIYRCTNLVNRQTYSGVGRPLQFVLLSRHLHDLKNDSKTYARACETRSKMKLPKFPEGRPCPPDPKELLKENKQGVGFCRSQKCMKNKEVLQAKDCQKKTETCDGAGDGGKKSNKWLLALLAGIGGLAFLAWWLTRGKKEETIVETRVGKVKVPASSADIPKYVPYLLIGGGTASFSAFRAIKSHDPKAKVLIISEEYLKPYMRPPLSKELWYHAEFGVIPKVYRFKQWNGAERSLFYEPEEFYLDPTKLMESQNGGVAVCQGYRVARVDSCNQQVYLSDGTCITYDKCLIATGCTPKSLEVFEGAPRNVKDKITTFQTPEDFEALKEIAETKKSVVVIGSGFIGSELSCALARYGKDRDLKVYQIFHESGNMAQVLPEYLSRWTTKQVCEQGVCVLSNTQVTEATLVHNLLKLNLNNGKSILTDHVVVCQECEPNTQIACTSDLEVDSKVGGFVVNAELEARRHLFVAGDAACFYDPLLGRRRVTHHDHSVISGRLAGENMVGLRKPYTHQSMFWSDLGPDIGYEGIGIVDSSLPTVGVFAKASPEDLKKAESNLQSVSFEAKEGEQNLAQSQEIANKYCRPDDASKTDDDSKTEDASKTDVSSATDGENKRGCTSEMESSFSETDPEQYGKGVIFYLKDNKVVGVLLWNLFNRINVARQVINENTTFEDLNEVAKLFEIHA